MFERHKQVFISQLTFNLMKRGGVGEKYWNEDHIQFLIRHPEMARERLSEIIWYSQSNTLDHDVY